MIEVTQEFFRWTTKYSVGVPELDEDHQILFELINQLRVVVKSGQVSMLGPTVDDLQQYMIYHFRREEELMMIAEYEYLENHKLVHRLMETRIQRFIDDPANLNNMDSAVSLAAMIESWLKDHTLGMDRNYMDCLDGIQV